jgi:thymidylate synthase (FAD)
MKIIKASAEILTATPDLEQVIELSGRVCYKSEDKITPESAEGFISRLMDSKHESVLEHGAVTVRFVVDRGVSHELVRHRIASFSQESTRYANYSKDKFGNEITVIEPCFYDRGSEDYLDWEQGCLEDEARYLRMIGRGRKPQEARTNLPNSLKTEVVMTANPREWRHVFKLRCAPTAHPQMREVMIPLAAEFAARWPSIFGVP